MIRTPARRGVTKAPFPHARGDDPYIPLIDQEGNITTELKQVVCADIKSNRMAGGMWRVDVDVNETDITIEAYTPPEA